MQSSSSVFFETFERSLLRCSWIYFVDRLERVENLSGCANFEWPHTRQSPTFPRFMAKSPVCQCCRKAFVPEPRSQVRQRFCRNPACQRARRTRTQQQRRLDRSPPTLAATGAKSRSRLLKPSEVDWLANHPLFVGYMMQVTGSQDAEDVRQFMFRLIQKGLDVLSTPNSGKRWKPLLAGHIQRPSKYIVPKR